MAATDPIPRESHRFSVRLPRPLWIGAAAVVLVVAAVVLQICLPFYRQQMAIQEIRRLGGTIETEAGGPACLRRWIGDSWMRPFDRGLIVNLSDTPLTDDGLRFVSALKSLEELDLYGTNVTDAGLKHLTGLTNLRALELNQTQIRGAGLSSLNRMDHLRYLNVEACPITDEGVGHIAEISSLTWLILGHTRTTTMGLTRLKSVRNLSTLALNRTAVTDSGVEELMDALPSLQRVDR